MAVVVAEEAQALKAVEEAPVVKVGAAAKVAAAKVGAAAKVAAVVKVAAAVVPDSPINDLFFNPGPNRGPVFDWRASAHCPILCVWLAVDQRRKL